MALAHPTAAESMELVYFSASRDEAAAGGRGETLRNKCVQRRTSLWQVSVSAEKRPRLLWSPGGRWAFEASREAKVC